MDQLSAAFRTRLIECLELLASLFQQRKFEEDVPDVYAPSEMISTFCDDLYHPKSHAFIEQFTEEQLKSLAELYGLLCLASKAVEKTRPLSVIELAKLPEWRAVMSFAKDLLHQLK